MNILDVATTKCLKTLQIVCRKAVTQSSKRFMPTKRIIFPPSVAIHPTLQTTHAIYRTMHAIDAIITP